jgi:tRNA pseudouridine38-40 synthase
MSEPADSSQRWKCICAYDGGTFDGWQSQVSGQAIQDLIEKRLAQLLGGPVRIHSSGRTDAGVHAKGQVFHFDGAWRHGEAKLLAALRTGLPQGIQVRSAKPIAQDFHARFSATGKTYVYQLFVGDPDPFTRPYVWALHRAPDLGLMEAAAVVLRGSHDFRAFSAFNGVEREDTVRELRTLAIARRGRRISVTAEADGFLYKMVRSLVGALVSAGEGKLGPERIRELLTQRTRTAEVHTAPPQGLFLMRVEYRRKSTNENGQQAVF